MICRKCGASIDASSKFCVYCGNPTQDNQQTIPVQESNQNIQNNMLNLSNEQPVNDLLNQNSVQNTNVSEINNAMNPINNTEIINQESSQLQQPFNNSSEIPRELAVQNLFGQQTQFSNANNGQNINPIIQQNIQSVNQPNIPVQVQPEKVNGKSNNKLFLIIGGAVALTVIAIVLLAITLIKSSNSSIAVLNKAIGNFEGKENGTITAKLTLESKSEDTINMSATVKFAKEKNDTYNMAFTLNKTLMYDEMSFYASLDNKKVTLYAPSQTVDLLGTTKSEENMWLYYVIDLEETLGAKENTGEVDFSKILDSKHFKYIDSTNNLKHYNLIINNDLKENIQKELTSEEREKLSESFSSFLDVNEKMTETYILDIYIDKDGNLNKLSMDLTKYMDKDDYSKVLFTLEFEKFGTTEVKIPDEALNSYYDLSTYMSLYKKVEETLDESPDSNLNYNYDSEATNYNYGV